MVDDTVQHGFLRTQIESARRHLRSMLDTLAKEAATTGREIALDMVCEGLQSMPVPILNKMLAQTVRRTFGRGRGSEGDNMADIVRLLTEMQQSNEGFEEGVRDLGLDLGQIGADIVAIKEHLSQQTLSDLRVLNPTISQGWPVFDNRVSMMIANIGGGSVVVDEIYLDVERWEPESVVDYTVPAAPLAELHLKAQLSVRQSEYPLFKINNMGQRIFNERGAGAERLMIDLSSTENARYYLRIRLSYMDLSSGEQRSLRHPALGDPPIILPFCYAPGWHEVDPGVLQDRPGILSDMESKFSGILDLMLKVRQNPDQRTEITAEKSQELGIPTYVLEPGIFHSFLDRFIPALAAIATMEGRQSPLQTILGILALLPTFAPEIGYPLTPDVVDAIAMLANNPELKSLIKGLIDGEQDVSTKERLSGQILGEIRPLR